MIKIHVLLFMDVEWSLKKFMIYNKLTRDLGNFPTGYVVIFFFIFQHWYFLISAHTVWFLYKLTQFWLIFSLFKLKISPDNVSFLKLTFFHVLITSDWNILWHLNVSIFKNYFTYFLYLINLTKFRLIKNY